LDVYFKKGQPILGHETSTSFEARHAHKYYRHNYKILLYRQDSQMRRFIPGILAIFSIAVLGAALAADPAAAPTSSQEGTSLKKSLLQATPGQTVTLPPGTSIDLRGLDIKVPASEVTLSGTFGRDISYREIISKATQELYEAARLGNFSYEPYNRLLEELKENSPESQLFDSAPKAYGSGLYLSQGGPFGPKDRLIFGKNGEPGEKNGDFQSLTAGGSRQVTIETLALGQDGKPLPLSKKDPPPDPLSKEAKVESSRQAVAAYDREALEDGGQGGISAPGGGFSLRNLRLSDSRGQVEASQTGASTVFPGLLGSDLTRQAKEPVGLKSLDSLLVTENEFRAKGPVHMVGGAIYLSHRRYPGLDYVYFPGGRGRNGEKTVQAFDSIESVNGCLFASNKSTSDPLAQVGLRSLSPSGAGWARVGLMDGNMFAGNINSGHHAFGGGFFAAKVENIGHSIFFRNIVESDHDSCGGALMSEGGIGQISQSLFLENSSLGQLSLAQNQDGSLDKAVNAEGGALSSPAGIDSVRDSFFYRNFVSNDTEANGPESDPGGEALGGAISLGGSGLNSLENSIFRENYVSAVSGQALGGALYLAGKDSSANGTLIRNSIFEANRAVGPQAGGGALAIDLGEPAVDAPKDEFALVLSATLGLSTTFSGNLAGERPNSIKAIGGSKNLRIAVEADEGAFLYLYDPIEADMGGLSSFRLENASEGDFYWDGDNVMGCGNPEGPKVSLTGGGATFLGPNFRLRGKDGQTLSLSVSGARIVLDLSGRDPELPFFQGLALNLTNPRFEIGYQGGTEDTQIEFLVTDEATTGFGGFIYSSGDPVSGPYLEATVGADGRGRLNYKAPVAKS
jgi:hypothetical protein